MKSNNPDQLSLFEVLSGEDAHSPSDNQISVTKVNFLDRYLSTDEELFKGYNELHVITFSYGIQQIEKIMHYFDRGEVILGCDKVVRMDVAELFALQQFEINSVVRSKYLKKRIENDEFRFYVLNDLISHQKVYLLKADDGRVRTITGSGNFSLRAWNGDQVEDYVVSDDPAFYEEYFSEYETLRDLSTSEIAKKAKEIKEDGSNAKELPAFKTVEVEHALVINTVRDDEEAEFTFQRTALSKQWEPRVKPARFNESKDGTIHFSLKQHQTILEAIKKDNERRKANQIINPQFVIDYDAKSAAFNQATFDLHPSAEAVKANIECIIEYFDNFEIFSGDVRRLKYQYWKVLNYMFLSPFIARLRYEGDKCGFEDRFFPMYLMIYGRSNAGKTGFIEFVHRLMVNKKIHPVSEKNFSPSPMTDIKINSKGFPIFIDELDAYKRNLERIVKMDQELITQRELNHPTFVIASNKVNAVKKQTSKRLIVINLDNRLGSDASACKAQQIRTLRQSADNSLYREYLRRMFDAIEKLIDDMYSYNSSDNADWIPDVFNLSAGVLHEIFTDYGIAVPEEFERFTWFDHMGEAVTGEAACNLIKSAFEYNPKMFYANVDKNELKIDFSCYDDNKARHQLEVLSEELPVDAECSVAGKTAIMHLDFISDITGINFKRKWFRRKGRH